MKKFGLLLLGLVAFTQLGVAQNIKNIFLDMPESITPLLSSVNKADFIDFLDSNMKAVVKNKFSRDSEMKTLGKDYIFIQMTEESTWQMKILPYKESYLIAITSTVCGPAKDSFLKIYSASWDLLSLTDFYKEPQLSDFVVFEEDVKDSLNLFDLKAIDLLLSDMKFNQENLELEVYLSSLDYLNEEMRAKVTPYFKKSLKYFWDGERFSPLQ